MLLLTNGRPGEAVLGVGQVIFLYNHVEIHLLHSQTTNLTRGLERHTSRRAVKVPRIKASQENQDQTLAHDVSVSLDTRRCKSLGSEKKKRKSLPENIYLKACFAHFC